MDLNKHLDFFNPEKINKSIHIIGLGALGSNLAIQLTRLGFDKFELYDFDEVDSHNITNQMYEQKDIGKTKIEALKEKMLAINPELKIRTHIKGWAEGTPLSGHLFSCVDSIELRKRILSDNIFNLSIDFVTDMRIGLEQAQMYATTWKNQEGQKRIISTMQFKDDEVEVQLSACGTELSVLPTVQTIVSLGTMNFINYLKTGIYNYQSIIDSIQGIATSYKA